jgi:hypothetical protein
MTMLVRIRSNYFFRILFYHTITLEEQALRATAPLPPGVAYDQILCVAKSIAIYHNVGVFNSWKKQGGENQGKSEQSPAKARGCNGAND